MLDRSKAPDIQEIEAISLQTAEVTELQNGARLHIIKSETQPVVRLDFVFKAGKWFEPHNGISDLAAKMLLEGSANYTASQIAEKVAYYGASFDSNHGYDRSEFTLYCLSKYLTDLLPLVLDVLQNPVFPEEEFKLLRKRISQNVKVQRQKNGYLATNSFTKLIYGEGHPYIFGYDGPEIEHIELIQLQDYYKNKFSTKELEIFACGSLDAEAQLYLKREIEQLILNAPNVAGTNNFENLPAQAEAFVNMPESLQSSIRVGKRFPHIQDEEYLKLLVLNEVLGGYFGSRLMRNIREDKGFTYGIYSAVSPKEHDTLFYIGTDVNYAVTDQTLHEIKKEIQILQQEAIPADELQTVKSYMIGKFINDLATIFEQCDRYKRIVLNNLPADYYNNYISSIKTVSAADLLALANKHLSLDDLKIAIAGKRA
ncbi:pitrilysin family protein [Pontibacter sp. SGAir0037]|uniref:M16 family metallopeptidase n=1 Tax=Pontibacter sp. SGAir0037 TaxID=2571030 RepID=UPI0010CD297F|nr:pitrilysin family protein [Pontibacter sp. SGAir0037]QCR24395.1 insulinase family protein [Pontibacter sp. SGAir0037]